ncbi:Plasmid replication initiator protein [Monaibacterium marinum]|uniref:Plasmid replication initiator protein n=1 Tax=Pontivivens marinum TaxID=1690039 RepID=A0A2C9CW45_9RHOB|nr:replication initiator protein A [Monaibacterium marinum]SOH95433.1 Plasmid replication initiator protein [Monaibacterium marinum]
MAAIDPAISAVQSSGQDFFLCDILGAIPKDDMASMEHPVFSLSTRPDRRVLSYTHNDVQIEITPSVKGLATIHDKDILIYCISQLIGALNAERPVSRKLTLRAHDLLVATRRETSGDGYRRLVAALERLAGTRITTNLVTGTGDKARSVTEGFGLIESWRIVRANKSGRMISVSITLSEWLFRGVTSRSVLTLSRDYFALRKPLERRVYEIARKHCGRQEEWRIGLEVLARKSGSASALRVFRKMIRDLVASNHLPDYTLSFDNDVLTVHPRAAIQVVTRDAAPVSHAKPGQGGLFLAPSTLDAARAIMPGADVHALAGDWRRYWATNGQVRVSDPDAAFLGFVRARAGHIEGRPKRR